MIKSSHHAELLAKIEQAELLREEGEVTLALSALIEVVNSAQDAGLADLVAAALAQRIICHKHLYQSTGDANCLNAMSEDINLGSALPIPEADKAVFLLRAGDVLMLYDRPKEAQLFYEKAFKAVHKGDYVEFEYLGHVAEAMACSGNCSEAIALLQNALRRLKLYWDAQGSEEIAPAKPLRPFHHAVLVSGLYARLAKASYLSGRYALAGGAFAFGYAWALKLKLRHNKPVRLQQYHRAIAALF